MMDSPGDWSQQVMKERAGMQWIESTDARLTVNGLAWHAENGGRFCRLPLRAEGVVRPQVWHLAQYPSGARVRFRSDTTCLSVRVAHSGYPQWDVMSLMAHTGMDLYVGPPGAMRCWGTTVPKTASTEYEHVYFSDVPQEEREFTLYLPMYNDLTRLEIGLSEGARLLPPGAGYALAKPVVFYGSSITHGGCCSRPGNSYVNILGRALNVDTVNLGMPGNGLGEPEVARLVAEIDAACYVLDFHINVETVEGLRQVYEPFFRTIRERRPDTPVLLLSQIVTTRELHSAQAAARRLGQRQVILDTFYRARAVGDRKVWFLDGAELIGPDADGAFVDGVHPNDRGFFLMAERLAPVLKQILGV